MILFIYLLASPSNSGVALREPKEGDIGLSWRAGWCLQPATYWDLVLLNTTPGLGPAILLMQSFSPQNIYTKPRARCVGVTKKGNLSLPSVSPESVQATASLGHPAMGDGAGGRCLPCALFPCEPLLLPASSS